MPCYECENGKWRFGETGKCQYDSKSSCETANKDYYAEETYNDYPQAATNNAKRAIKYKEENGSDCGTQVGWTRARQLANRDNLSRDTIARMASFKDINNIKMFLMMKVVEVLCGMLGEEMQV
jgi:hypothetical protein